MKTTIYGAAARAAIGIIAAPSERSVLQAVARKRCRPCRFATKTSSSVIRQWRSPRSGHK
jgi:hypothetical protein